MTDGTCFLRDLWLECCGRLCADCADDHGEECDRPAFLPVVNSPRSGVCGYTG